MTLPPRSADRERHASTDPATPEYWFLRVRFCSFDDSDFPVEASLCRLASCPAAFSFLPQMRRLPRSLTRDCLHNRSSDYPTPLSLAMQNAGPPSPGKSVTVPGRSRSNHRLRFGGAPLFLQQICSEISLIG